MVYLFIRCVVYQHAVYGNGRPTITRPNGIGEYLLTTKYYYCYLVNSRFIPGLFL